MEVSLALLPPPTYYEIRQEVKRFGRLFNEVLQFATYQHPSWADVTENHLIALQLFEDLAPRLYSQACFGYPCPDN